MRSKEEFDAFYRETLVPALEELELRRQRILRHSLMAAGIGLVAGALLMGTTTGFGQAVSYIVPAVAALLLGALVGAISGHGFKGEFKDRVVREVVHFVEPSLTYHPERGIGQSTFRNARLFKHSIDRYKSEDHVSGRIDRTDFEFSEVKAEYKTTRRDSDGDVQTDWHTIFDGIMFIADFNKEFRTPVVVLPDVAERTLGRFGKWLQEKNFARADLVKLEDPRFEEQFVVYSDDQIEARYILSTSLMQRILDFREKTGKDIYLSFVNSHIYVAIPTREDLFEPRIFRSLMDPTMCEEYLEDLLLAVGIVEDLDLNTRIWSKE
jgi:hypothetical protein